ncbi:disease resistance RPP13-like protein 4 [Tasmannia lanceolata]|uniref:disease resistance RPP13-like protein 4 n=1 Tax=Tasmannia lanceolata TaxID=3420 RepID=UPI0040647B0D
MCVGGGNKEEEEEEAFVPLRARLSAVKTISSYFSDRIDTCEKHFQQITQMLLAAHDWKRRVVDELQTLTQLADDFVESLPISPPANNPNQPHILLNSDIRSKGDVLLTKVGEAVGKIKSEAPQFPSTYKVEQKAKVAVDEETNWERLKNLDKILKSPAMVDVRASYNALDDQLKLCFLFLCIFPEDSTIGKRHLIHWWIGEDLVKETRDKQAEMVGEDCFQRLYESGLVVPIYNKRSKTPQSCKLQSWVRWMGISIAKETGFFGFNSEGRPTSSSSECGRRKCLTVPVKGKNDSVVISPAKGKNDSVVISPAKGKNDLVVISPVKGKNDSLVISPVSPGDLRSLFNVNAHYLKCERRVFSKMRSLAILQLGRWKNLPKYHIEVEDTTFLKRLGLLKSLRYLGLQGISRITELPESINKLTNLRVLDLRACHNLETLAVGISSLENLTHLDVSECYLLEEMPKGLGSLSKLQVLKGFVIGNSSNDGRCKLDELTQLNSLRKLSINIGSEAQIEELHELGKLPSLSALTIIWAGILLSSTKSAGENSMTSAKLKVSPSLSKKGNKKSLTRMATMSTVTSLSLPLNLEKLDLQCFPGKEAPNWLVPDKLNSLKKLYFRGGQLSNLKEVKKDGLDWQVEILRLKYLKDLAVEWHELKEVFPCLNCVEIVGCPEIKSFQGDKDGVWVEGEEACTSNSNDGASTSNSNDVASTSNSNDVASTSNIIGAPSAPLA